MADQNPTDRDRLDPFSSTGEDRKIQGAILALLLAEHPIRFTIDELVRVLHGGDDLFATTDATEVAIHELVGAGLLHHEGRFLFPSRAALYFDHLEA